MHNTDLEIWKDIQGYEGKYQVSNYGRIKSLPRFYYNRKEISKEIIRKLVHDTDGYLMVSFPLPGRKLISLKIHQLVAKHFKRNYIQGHPVCHKDGDKLNNHESNLYVGSNVSNVIDRYKQKRTKLTLLQIREIKDSNEPQKVIAERYNIQQSYVSRIKTGTRGKMELYSALFANEPILMFENA